MATIGTSGKSTHSDSPHTTSEDLSVSHPAVVGMSDEEASQATAPSQFSDSKSKGSVKSKKVVHKVASYQDFSWDMPDKKELSIPRTVSSGSTKEPTFPVKLHAILSNLEYADIISWLPHGRSWRILQQQAFKEKVIPIFFRHGRYSSFARQVNGWGFKRISHGSDFNSYYHEMFLRGMPHLCDRMRRLTAKDMQGKKHTENEVAPNFYAISRRHPLPDVDGTPYKGKPYPEGMGEEDMATRRPAGYDGGDVVSVCSQTVDAEASVVSNVNSVHSSSLNSLAAASALSASLRNNRNAPVSFNEMIQEELALVERQRQEILLRLAALEQAAATNRGDRVIPSLSRAQPALDQVSSTDKEAMLLQLFSRNAASRGNSDEALARQLLGRGDF
eukprot:Nitzschia sp. Nitz4//scaffold151_size53849//43855//45101//NITZ4_006730-RA/size53849-snap-gene-0.35-mRNA-1//-1//CDS//3329537165//4805//frame0